MRTDRYILDDNGEPIPEPDLLKWARWFETSDRHTTKTETEDGVTISTVFLGLNHNYGEGQPLLFETMIFGGDHDGYQDRYATRTEALAGHERAVLLVAESRNQ